MRAQQHIPFLCVSFFAAVVLLMEILLFHIFNYVHDYFVATLAISYTVLGIGVGAFVAKMVKFPERELFALCCLGTTVSLFLVAMGIVMYPAVWLLLLLIPLCFLFPVAYITRIFSSHRSNYVYLYDMVGAGIGVFAIVFLYQFFISEEIVFLILLFLSIAGLLVSISFRKGWKKHLYLLFIITIFIAGTLQFEQITKDSFNLYRIINRDFTFGDSYKIFSLFSPDKLVKSYDSLAGRIDYLMPSEKWNLVVYNGFGNDHFTGALSRDYDYYKQEGITEPTKDTRVLYGAVEAPKVFINGSSAQGIIKTVKRITPVDNIVPVEINPGVLQIMQKDFYEESGKAYKGLNPILGNGLSVLKSLPEKFDIITFINTHPSRSISHPGAPDYLHTFESYDEFIDHLSGKGYLLFEERLLSREGELGFYRMLNTLWHVLEERGVSDPSRHFVIWDWMSGKRDKFQEYNISHYISMIVTREPIEGDFRKAIMSGLKRAIGKPRRAARVVYVKDEESMEEYVQLFQMIEQGDFSPLAAEQFDASLITNDRPFAAMSSTHTPRLNRLLLISGSLAFLLCTLFVLGTIRGSNKRLVVSRLNAFNILTGLAYFLIEIILILTYQNVFVATSSTLVLVLGLLLVSSGIGGFFAHRLRLWSVTCLLVPISLMTISAPALLISAGVSFSLIKLISVMLISLTGFLMGMYFPKGLLLAKEEGLQDNVPYFFALSSIAGSFAVVLALFLGVKVGYSVSLVVALVCYVLAGVVIRSLEQRVRV